MAPPRPMTAAPTPLLTCEDVATNNSEPPDSAAKREPERAARRR